MEMLTALSLRPVMVKRNHRKQTSHHDMKHTYPQDLAQAFLNYVIYPLDVFHFSFCEVSRPWTRQSDSRCGCK